MADSNLTGTVTFKKHEGQGTDRERVSLKIGEEWYGIFPSNEKTDEVTAQVVREVKEGDDIAIEFYRNQKGFLTISKAVGVTHVEGDVKPEDRKVGTPPGGVRERPQWTKKAGGGGWVKQAAPPKELEEAKYPAFSASYAKDVTISLIANGKVKDLGEAGAVFVHMFGVIYQTLKGTKE